MSVSRSAIPVVAMCVALALVFASCVVWSGMAEKVSDKSTLLTNIGEIKRIDEVLTSAALLASATGDAAYKARYFDHVEFLDSLLAESMTLFESAEARQMLERTEAANRALVAIEDDVLAKTDGRPHLAAYARLRSADYIRNKQVYAAGIDGALDELKRNAKAEIARMRMVLTGSVLLSFLLGVAALIAYGKNRFRSAAHRHRDRQYTIMRAMVGSFMDIQNNLLNNMVYFRTKLAHDLPFDEQEVDLIDKEIETAKQKLEELAESGIGEAQDLGGIVVLKEPDGGNRPALKARSA